MNAMVVVFVVVVVIGAASIISMTMNSASTLMDIRNTISITIICDTIKIVAGARFITTTPLLSVAIQVLSLFVL